MSYKTINEFLKDWKFESESTIKILSNLDDESLSVKAYNEGRSLGFIAWHLAVSIHEMCSRAGLILTTTDLNTESPVFAEIILNTYDKLSKSLVNGINLNWTDTSLSDDVEMYGEIWKKSQVLDSLIKHQIHHRGQMTILMRQAGLKVPGIYGPSKEEWTSMGMSPQD